MSDTIVQGLILSLVGMGLTFLALGILILVMVLLDRLFRDKDTVASAETIPQETLNVTVRETEDEEIIAAIATALTYWRSISQSGLGSTLETAPSPWWAMGRAQQSPANALQRIKGRN